jgi:hypothetical protein
MLLYSCLLLYPIALSIATSATRDMIDTRLNKIIGFGHITRKVLHPALLVGMFQYAMQETTKEQTAIPSFSVSERLR